MAPTSELNVVDATEITAHHPPGDTGLIERMWAGGEFTFNRDLHVGDEVITESTVEKVKDFTGRDGRQGLFVTQRREMRSADAREEEPAVVEKRIYLHRPATVAAAQPKPKASTPRESDFAAPSLLTDVHLVRFRYAEQCVLPVTNPDISPLQSDHFQLAPNPLGCRLLQKRGETRRCGSWRAMKEAPARD